MRRTTLWKGILNTDYTTLIFLPFDQVHFQLPDSVNAGNFSRRNVRAQREFEVLQQCGEEDSLFHEWKLVAKAEISAMSMDSELQVLNTHQARDFNENGRKLNGTTGFEKRSGSNFSGSGQNSGFRWIAKIFSPIWLYNT